MLKIIFILFFSFTACSSLKQNNLSKKAFLYEKIGMAFLQQKNYPSALSRFIKAEKLDNQSASIKNYLGLSYFALKKYAISIFYFKKAIKIVPQQTEYKNNLAYALIKNKKYKLAFSLLKNNLKDLTYSFHYKTYFYLSLIKEKKGHLVTATKLINKSLSLNNNFCPSHLQSARLLNKVKFYIDSNNQLNNVFLLCPEYKNYTNLFIQAKNYYRLKNYIKAFAIFNKILKSNSKTHSHTNLQLNSKIKKFLKPKIFKN